LAGGLDPSGWDSAAVKMNHSSPRVQMIDPESRREYRTGGTSGTNYRPEIDGLRAVAVLAVIANHFNEDILASGYLGVDVFFVISGYVITLSLSSKQSTTLWAFTGDFFKRRIKRLAPALFTCVTVTALLLCIFNYQTASHINTGIASLFGISNIYLHHFQPITSLIQLS